MFLNMRPNREARREFVSEPSTKEASGPAPVEKRCQGMVDAEIKGYTLRVYILALKKR